MEELILKPTISHFRYVQEVDKKITEFTQSFLRSKLISIQDLVLMSGVNWIKYLHIRVDLKRYYTGGNKRYIAKLKKLYPGKEEFLDLIFPTTDLFNYSEDVYFRKYSFYDYSEKTLRKYLKYPLALGLKSYKEHKLTPLEYNFLYNYYSFLSGKVYNLVSNKNINTRYLREVDIPEKVISKLYPYGFDDRFHYYNYRCNVVNPYLVPKAKNDDYNYLGLERYQLGKYYYLPKFQNQLVESLKLYNHFNVYPGSIDTLKERIDSKDDSLFILNKFGQPFKITTEKLLSFAKLSIDEDNSIIRARIPLALDHYTYERFPYVLMDIDMKSGELCNIYDEYGKLESDTSYKRIVL